MLSLSDRELVTLWNTISSVRFGVSQEFNRCDPRHEATKRFLTCRDAEMAVIQEKISEAIIAMRPEYQE